MGHQEVEVFRGSGAPGYRELLESVLNDAGIACVVKAASGLPQHPFTVGPMSQFSIFVSEDDADRAITMLNDIQVSDADGADPETDSVIDDSASIEEDFGPFPPSPWNGWDVLKGALAALAILGGFLYYYSTADWVRDAPFAVRDVLWVSALYVCLLGPLWFFTIHAKGSIADLPIQRVASGVLLLVALGALFWIVVDSYVWSVVASILDVPTSQAYWWGTNERLGADDLPILALTTIVAAPIAEETLFRGILLRYFGSFLRPWQAISLVAGLFAIFHFQPVGIPSRFLFGVIAGGLVLFSRSLYPAIVFHMTLGTYAVLGVTRTL